MLAVDKIPDCPELKLIKPDEGLPGVLDKIRGHFYVAIGELLQAKSGLRFSIGPREHVETLRTS